MKIHRRTDWLWWLIFALSAIGWGFFVLVMLGMAGCQSSTSIQGGTSEASATTTSSKMRVNVTTPSVPAPQPPGVTVRVRITEGENPCR